MIKKLFTFWKKKEKPNIKWWSTIEGLDKVVPIVPAKEVIPVKLLPSPNSFPNEPVEVAEPLIVVVVNSAIEPVISK